MYLVCVCLLSVSRYKCFNGTGWRALGIAFGQVLHVHYSMSLSSLPWQGASILHGLCVWIVTSLDSATAADVTQHVEDSVETHDWDLFDLATLWQMLLQRQKTRTLLNGLRFFLKVMTYMFSVVIL